MPNTLICGGTPKPPITEQEYAEAIGQLQAGMTQLEPDSRSCAVCGDGGHQAWECRHNPLVLARSFQRIDEGASELHDLLHKLIFLGGY
jgi:hypothetical protein